ncbi:hypothetical protein [Flavobacterium microcysteis]
MKKLGLVLVLCLAFLSCEKKKITHSFCFWKTKWYTHEEDIKLQKEMDVQHFYVRFFDVDWNPYDREPRPVATLQRTTLQLPYESDIQEITPSIFITNNVLLNSNKGQLDTLAKNIQKRMHLILDKFHEVESQKYAIDYAAKVKRPYESKLIDSIMEVEKKKGHKMPKEVLIDCDWTVKSKDNYFYLLEKLKQPDYKLSATIRLWQYKYFEKAGIPPVDKGLLMCYNLSSPSERKTENSIATSREIEEYITHSDYKLPLDIALPIFSWSVVFRGDQFKGIISDNSAVDFENDTLNIKKIADNKYVLKNDMIIGESFFRNGDEIRIEKISDSEMQKMIRHIKSKIKLENNAKITFFSWDIKFIQNYGTDKINSYYAQFER